MSYVDLHWFTSYIYIYVCVCIHIYIYYQIILYYIILYIYVLYIYILCIYPINHGCIHLDPPSHGNFWCVVARGSPRKSPAGNTESCPCWNCLWCRWCGAPDAGGFDMAVEWPFRRRFDGFIAILMAVEWLLNNRPIAMEWDKQDDHDHAMISWISWFFNHIYLASGSIAIFINTIYDKLSGWWFQPLWKY